MLEADAAFGPFLIFGEDVFGDKSEAGGAADEFEVKRVGLRGDQGEDGLAVRRGDGDKAFAGLQFGVVGEVEAELVNVKAQAAILVADVNVDGVDAEMRRGIRSWCWGRHGEIIRRGAEQKEKITQRRRVRGDAQRKGKQNLRSTWTIQRTSGLSARIDRSARNAARLLARSRNFLNEFVQ